MNEKKKYTAADLVGLIRCKYSGNAYTVLEQVADGTGGGCGSWIDAAVFSLWPSKGIWRAACEVKVSRADFLNELSNPNKNEWARKHFDFFWYVVAPGVAKDDEAPTGCGVMTVRGGGLSIVKQAPRREDVKTDKWVIASFARSLDKERERFKKDGLREAIESDRTYLEAKGWKEAGERFLKDRGEYCYGYDANEIYAELSKAANGKTPESHDAEHMLYVLGSLQDNVIQFLQQVAPLAGSLLNARDEAGEYIVGRWGSRDDGSIESLRAAIKNNGNSRPSRKDARHKLATRQLLQAGTQGESTPELTN